MSDLVINGALVLLLLAVVGSTVKTTLFVSKMKEDILSALKAQAETLTAKLAEQEKSHLMSLAELERDHQDEMARMGREFGETCNAIRQKVHDFEKWSRDEFVRKTSFETVIGRLEKGIEVLGDKIEKRLDRMAERIEKISHE